VAVPLTPTETALLAYLHGAKGRIVSQQELLREVWGYASGVRTRTVYSTVNRLRGKIEEDAAHPEHLLAVPRRGYRLVVENSEGVQGSFHGRRRELGQLEDLLRQHTVVTLVGPGGAGKTRLARHYAETVAGAWFCDARSAETPQDLEDLVATAAGLQNTETLADALAARGLLVLDNLEQCVQAAATALSKWGTPVLATSRLSLGLAGEGILRLGPLDEGQALELLRRRAGDAEASEQALTALVELTGGWPLALELAAGRLTLMNAGALVKRLRRSGPLKILQGPGSSHASLRQAVEGTWGLLQPHHQRALIDLAGFPGDFSLEAAEHLVTLEALEFLVRCSLVARRGGRYRLLIGVRAFALEHGTSQTEGLDDYVRTLDEPADDLDERNASWRNEQGLIASRMSAAVARRDVDFAERCLGMLGQVGLVFGPVDVLQRRIATLEPLGRTRTVRLWAARVGLFLGRLAEAEAELEGLEGLEVEAERGWLAFLMGRRDEALERLHPNPDAGPVVELDVWRRRGLVLTHALRREEARQVLERALHRADELGSVLDRGQVLIAMGILAAYHHDWLLAETHWRAAAELTEGVGAVHAHDMASGNHASMLMSLGRIEEAEAGLRQVLERCRRSGSRRFGALARMNLGRLELLRGDGPAARAHFEDAVATMESMGESHHAHRARLGFAESLMDEDTERAQALLVDLETSLTELGDKQGSWRARVCLAQLSCLAGDPDAAEPYLTGDEPDMQVLRAWVARLRGAEDADALLKKARARISAIGTGPRSDLGLRLARVEAL